MVERVQVHISALNVHYAIRAYIAYGTSYNAISKITTPIQYTAWIKTIIIEISWAFSINDAISINNHLTPSVSIK